MATNTAALKTFAQETRKKLISLISTKMDFILTQDTAELRGFESQIAKLKSAIATKGKELVVEEVAYTWFNRVMALRYMDANGYTDLKVVTPGMGQMRPEILQEAMAGNIDEDLHVKVDDNPKEAVLYRRLLVAVCNQYGTTMPFLFEHICDYTEMLLPEDLLSDQSFVTDIRNGMTDEDCQNVEIMGWLYQFYITDRKDVAEKKKSKKGGLKSDEQAAATQLFTPHWVVRYMVENSLGRIWMTLHPESHLKDEMPYYIASPEGKEDTIPEDIHSVQDIRFIDPCMGSGHVLVYAFDLFCKMYEEEGYQSREIPALILQNNIFGLDIDRRCYQLASFALTMKGRAYHSRYLRKVVEPNVIALQSIDHDTIDASGSWGQKSLMWQFENIDTIGSLLKVTPEECAAIRVDEGLFGFNQQILKTQAEYLSRSYHCAVTNPPYLGKGIGDALKSYLQKEFPKSKSDTMATFMERCISMIVPNGKTAMINMHSWMFITTYANLREDLLSNYQIDSLLHLGPHAFDEIGGEVVQSATFVLSKHTPQTGIYFNLMDGACCSEKESMFLNRSNKFDNVIQSNFLRIPDYVVGYWATDSIIKVFSENKAISEHAEVRVGMHTGSNDLFVRNWFEINLNKICFNCNSHEESKLLDDYKWFPYNKGGGTRKWYGFKDYVVDWWKGGVNIHKFHNIPMTANGAPVRAKGLQFKESGTWSFVGSNMFSLRYSPSGSMFDVGGSSLFSENLKYLIGFLCSKVARVLLSIENPTLNYQVGNIADLPIIYKNIDSVESLTNDSISISRSDWDSHETSWDFKTNELLRLALDLSCVQDGTTLMTTSRLNLSLESLVSQYIVYWEEKFIQLHRNEEELNRLFIDIYGLKDELSPDVPLDEITILQKGEINIVNNKIIWHKDVVIKQFLSWMIGCFMGRFSADKPGLIIASQGLNVSNIEMSEQTLEIDDDGIIPIIQEADFFADDMTQRIESGIKTLFGEQNFSDNMKYIKICLGQDLRDYLYKDYYDDHMQMYSVKGSKLPIYWLFSSKMGDKKKKGYFKALVYMHRIESDTLSKLHADYVSPYLDKIEQQKQEAEDDAVRDDLSQAQRNKANKQATELAEKVREVKEFATILAQMSTQRLTIDLDDGVKANYPKYYPLVEPIKGLDAKED